MKKKQVPLNAKTEALCEAAYNAAAAQARNPVHLLALNVLLLEEHISAMAELATIARARETQVNLRQQIAKIKHDDQVAKRLHSLEWYKRRLADVRELHGVKVAA